MHRHAIGGATAQDGGKVSYSPNLHNLGTHEIKTSHHAAVEMQRDNMAAGRVSDTLINDADCRHCAARHIVTRYASRCARSTLGEVWAHSQPFPCLLVTLYIDNDSASSGAHEANVLVRRSLSPL
jgi:hypothetical protein